MGVASARQGTSTIACLSQRPSHDQLDTPGSTHITRLSLRWFEPNTCHHLRKRPVAWAYPGSRAFFLLSRCVSCCAAVSPCIAVVTDIWRTESGRSKRFTEPLVLPIAIVSRLGEGRPGPGNITRDRRLGLRMAHRIRGQSRLSLMPGRRHGPMEEAAPPGDATVHSSPRLAVGHVTWPVHGLQSAADGRDEPAPTPGRSPSGLR